MVVLTLTLFVWHSPSIFDRAITTEWIHYTQYATVLFAGLLFWWPLVTRSQVLPRMRPLAMLGYTFGTIVLQTVLFGPLMIMMLDEPLYQIYIHAPRLINISPVEDQQFGHMLFMVVSPATLLIYFTKAISELIRESGAPTRASTPKP
jgi:cytochrome c oxidase assembly factor CtaG